jgi:hypothetical protein
LTSLWPLVLLALLLALLLAPIELLELLLLALLLAAATVPSVTSSIGQTRCEKRNEKVFETNSYRV